MKMKNGTIVMTESHGTGTIIGRDYYFNEDFRYIVDLDDKSKWFPSSQDPKVKPHYFPREVKPVESN